MQRRLVAGRCCMALVVLLTLKCLSAAFRLTHADSVRNLVLRADPGSWLPSAPCRDRGYPSPPPQNRKPALTPRKTGPHPTKPAGPKGKHPS